MVAVQAPPQVAARPQVARPQTPTIHPAVARIVAPGQSSISYGSGTLVYADDQRGVVITNWHVVNEATGPISVHFPDGFYSLGTVQAADRDWDLAAITIRRPNVQPVPLAASAPRPGEVLTIAGYGSGTYRAASGLCTQYVAPGTTFPYEMVEVAVSARQGDSGGPIFNSRGELAGVLFGEGGGRTSGSYCGRVRWFLSSVVPIGTPSTLPGGQSGVALAAANRQPSRTAQIADQAPSGRTQSTRDVTLAGAVAEPISISTGRPFGGAGANAVNASNSSSNARVVSAPIVASTRAGEAPLAAQTLTWRDIAGDTVSQQVKTVLAAVGALAIILHALHWLSRDRPPAKSAGA